MEVIYSEKNKLLYVIDNHKFYFQKKLRDGIQRWACCHKTCKSYIKLSATKGIIERVIMHNHEKIPEKILNRQKVSNSLKLRATKDLSLTPNKIIQELKTEDVSSLISSDIKLIRNNIYAARHRQPKYIDETQTAVEEMQISNTASQMQRKTLKDCSTKVSPKTETDKNGSAGENGATFARGIPFSQSAEEETQARSDDEGEITETGEVNTVTTSQNFSPVSSKIKERVIDQQMLPQPFAASVPTPVEVHNSGDPDMHFLLSLLPHFKAIPEHLKFEAQFDIMGVIKKYKTSGHAQSSYYPHQNNVVDPLQQNNPSSHTEISDSLQTSTYCKMESVDSFPEAFSSDVIGYDDEKFRRPDL